jgi:hypothetical protein
VPLWRVAGHFYLLRCSVSYAASRKEMQGFGKAIIEQNGLRKLIFMLLFVFSAWRFMQNTVTLIVRSRDCLWGCRKWPCLVIFLVLQRRLCQFSPRTIYQTENRGFRAPRITSLAIADTTYTLLPLTLSTRRPTYVYKIVT